MVRLPQAEASHYEVNRFLLPTLIPKLSPTAGIVEPRVRYSFIVLQAIVENRADLIWLYLQAGAPLMMPLSSSQSGDDPGGLTALAKMVMRGIEKDILKEAIESAITQCGGIEQFLQQIAELPSVNWIPLVRIVPENDN
jgi:hypothetical protein